MKKYILVAVLLTFIISCKKEEEKKEMKPSFETVSIDTLLQDKISIRALTIDGDKAWYAGSNGKYGWVSLSGGKNFNGVISTDTILPEFRAIAQTKSDVFILNVGSPAVLYKITKDGKTVRKVYEESGEKVFYDSMQFYNDNEGMAMGDPTDGCLSVIKTTDDGETWTKLSCDNLPKVEDGEAAFAASNTNLVVKGNNAWMVSGGKKSRLFSSSDKGKSWKVYNTPIVQGSEMTGIFSVDFYDETIGFAVGGNYEQRDKNSGNKILTTDGGKNWELIGENSGFGYASCVQFMPNSDGNELVTCGSSGVFYSYNRGQSWKKIHDDASLHTLRFVDNKTIIAAGQDRIIRLRLK
ncbi:oxidoreductase [Flavobacterium salilacus subsp. salilacus]|uniref:WD40/YVTN/BNR-like repeat-containing protein n=1 Tax=Flavobacterium TaxID=237 RepID=UPI001074C6FA|nr:MULTISPECIES: oxidoreductase [Flavobacterium]KAF2518757.1 oxidoreductase [Flavobacterium salilacus subsp. salilacus]MBE1613725.1 oxidoreductase [Flavobacterium sp. SaA2.13]